MNTHILAIDIGGTNTKLALIDSDGNAGQVSSIPTSGERGLDYFLRSVTDTAHQMINQSVKSDVVGVGIGVAGFVDPAHTQMVFNPNVTWLEGANLKDHFSSNLNLPVYLDSEVLDFVQRVAKKRKTDISSVVNNLIRNDIQMIEITK